MDIKFRAYHERWGWARPEDIIVYGDGSLSIDYRGNDGDIVQTHDERDKQLHLVKYTGLKDKNGKEIFEGDIIISKRFPQPQIAEWAIFYDGHCCSSSQYSGFSFACDGSKDLKIIGNIYENPELLNA